MTCVCVEAAMVPVQELDALSVLKAVQNENCTALHGMPTMFIAELNHPGCNEVDLPSLRTGIMAGSPCPTEIMRTVTERMGAREITGCRADSEPAK